MMTAWERALARIENEIEQAQAEVDADTEEWSQLGTGQNTEEAEASGVLLGVVDGLKRALELLYEEGGSSPQ